jgi:uncharacterized protein YodC (DUF2158 family)
MPKFYQGENVRTTDGNGPSMTVDGYAPTGEVICTYWLKGVRKQENFVEDTLELVPPQTAPEVFHPKRPRY